MRTCYGILLLRSTRHLRPRLLFRTVLLKSTVVFYCNSDHLTNSCDIVKDVQARKDILRRAGRCYICLRRNHISKNCRSALKCGKCQGRHHETICHRTATTVQDSGELSTACAHVQAPVLLQTARATVQHSSVMTQVRALLTVGANEHRSRKGPRRS